MSEDPPLPSSKGEGVGGEGEPASLVAQQTVVEGPDRIVGVCHFAVTV